MPSSVGSVRPAEGDDARLVLPGAEGRAPAPALFVGAPAGNYDLLIGNPTAEAPRYELARVRDVGSCSRCNKAENNGDNVDWQ